MKTTRFIHWLLILLVVTDRPTCSLLTIPDAPGFSLLLPLGQILKRSSSRSGLRVCHGVTWNKKSDHQGGVLTLAWSRLLPSSALDPGPAVWEEEEEVQHAPRTKNKKTPNTLNIKLLALFKRTDSVVLTGLSVPGLLSAGYLGGGVDVWAWSMWESTSTVTERFE